MNEVDVQQLEATVSLPFPHRGRAEAALRGWLRLAAADDGVHPRWSTMTVTELEDDRDEHGRTWWRWTGVVSVEGQPAAAGSAPTKQPPPQP